MKKTRSSFLLSVTALILCFAMLLGSTFAWFTDIVTSSNNKIVSGSLDLDLLLKDKQTGQYTSIKENSDPVFDYDNWEPGYTDVKVLKVLNAGSLSLKWVSNFVSREAITKLAQVIDVYVKTADNDIAYPDERTELTSANGWKKIGTLNQIIDSTIQPVNGQLLPGEADYFAVALHMQESAGNEYQNTSVGAFDITVHATQYTVENDSFGPDYDQNAQWPSGVIDGTIVASSAVTTDENGKVTTAVTMANGKVSATVPAGTQLVSGTTNITVTVTPVRESQANVTLSDTEKMLPVDVHIDGVAENNDVPIPVYLTEWLDTGLNIGNYHLYHVENGVTTEMTLRAGNATPVHNNFDYDPATGDVVLYMASFSEVAIVADTLKAWEGNLDYSWYDADATELKIANADQLAAFGAIVGGMAKDKDGNFLITYTDSDGDEHHNDFFEGKTVKLLADINLGDKESENDPDLIFYPIGYWNSEGTYEKTGTAISSGFYAFKGTFDGNGNTIKNFYQNTWEMKGDHDWYDATLQYYRDGMGLFGKILGGTVKNLTVENFSCDSEIGTSGVIAAYADSMNGKPATFENITITNCNPRVYNIGNGGIVGCAGWYSRNDSLGTDDYTNAVTFRNITVDQTNKISALWGSWGVSCAGILGQYYPDSKCGIKLENCHVAAIIDVNNDVCSNYQYYWYRYAGMFIGTIRANTTDANGYTVADTTGVTASGCTYTMGNWNEYWYCEIVANSLASYTHDHQFSRLENIYDLSEISDDDGKTWKKEGHFALLDENRDIVDCYHIFKNSEGVLYRHFHDVADESNPNIYEDFDLDGNGKLDDLKEDRQRYFIPFNQLLTGLDMGIKAHTEFDGIEFVPDGTVKSEEKFESLGNVTTYRPGQTITLGQLVESIVDDTKLSKATLYAAVSPATENDAVSATYSLDLSDWKNSTLTFAADSEGSAKIVITDYFYCTATVIYLDPEQAAEKFNANGVSPQNAYTQITLGTLFGIKDGANIGNVTATVTDPDGKETTITGTSSDWTTKTIDLTKDGTWTVVIKDDDAYCAVTTATFTVNKADKFTKKFDKDFLYRVGNEGTVAIGKIFGDATPTISPVNLNVTIENIAGNAAGTFTPNATWTNGTIQFTGTGVVKVTISADGANPVELCLEVVDATNVTGLSGEITGNVVLLQDCGISSLTVSGRNTVYGNGFTATYTDNGQYLNNGLKQGVITVKDNGTLDNLRVVAPIYPRAYLYYGSTSLGDYVQGGPYDVGPNGNRYHYQLSAVAASGNATISNCYIYGGRNNIFVNTGDVTIKDTILECGTVANIQIQSTSEYTVTLNNVTTIQYQVNATIGDTSKVMLGAGVVVGPDTTSNPTIILNGNFKQYNWVNEYDGNAVSDEVAKKIINGALEATAYNHTIDGNKSSNLGIIYMNEAEVLVENNTKLPYVLGEISMSGVDGQAYSLQNATESQIYSDYQNADRSTVNGDYIPRFDFDLGDQEISYDGSEDTRYLYGDKNGVSALYQDGYDALTLDLTKLATIYKYDGDSSYPVTVVCKDSNGNTLTVTNGVVTLSALGSYTLEFTVDDNIFYDKNGQTITKSVTRTYTVPVSLTVKAADIKNAEVSITKTALDGVYTTVNLTDYKLRINFLDCISVTDYDNTGTGTTVDLTSNIASATLTPASVNVFTTASTLTITYNDGRVLTVNFSKISGSSPGTKTATVNTSGGLYFITDGALNNKPTEASSQNKCTITSVSYTGNSGSTVTNDTDVTVTWALGSSSGGGTCIAEGSMITLADGSKKPVEELRRGDLVMAFDHITGKVVYRTVNIVGKTYADMYYKNVFVFDDGTELTAINEHGIYDIDLKKYVNIGELNYKEYIGHRFVSIDTNGNIGVKRLIDVVTTVESGYKYDIVTNETLNYVVEDTLSVTHEVVDIMNSFEFSDNMLYDAEKMQEDIEKYGLYAYEDFAEYCEEPVFEQYNMAMMKVGVGKGLYTKEHIVYLLTEIALNDDVQIID